MCMYYKRWRSWRQGRGTHSTHTQGCGVENRLTSDTHGTNSVQLVYDSDSKRVKKVDNSTTTYCSPALA